MSWYVRKPPPSQAHQRFTEGYVTYSPQGLLIALEFVSLFSYLVGKTGGT